MTERVHVTCSRADRLGARLRNCLYALEFSERIGAALTINWAPTADGLGQENLASDHDQYRFYDLFEQKGFTELHPGVDVSCLSVAEHMAWIQGESYAALSKIGYQPHSYFSNAPHSRIFYDTTHPYYFSQHPEPCGAVGPMFAQLPLHEAVASALQRVETSWPLADSLCLHVRRGDIMEITRLNEDRRAVLNKYRLGQARHFSFKYAPYEAYQRAIEELGDGRSIVVFSDDAEVKQRFARDYGDRCVNYAAILDPLPLTPQQRDFVELLLISRCGESVGLRSAFVELATLIGNRKLHSIHRYIDADILIRDVGDLIGRAESSEKLYTYILKEFSARFAKYGFLDTMKAIDSHLESMALTG